MSLKSIEVPFIEHGAFHTFSATLGKPLDPEGKGPKATEIKGWTDVDAKAYIVLVYVETGEKFVYEFPMHTLAGPISKGFPRN